jgi:hypothetical protein
MTSLTSEKLEFSDEISSKTLYTSIYKTRRKAMASLSLYTLKAKSVHQCCCLAFIRTKKEYASGAVPLLVTEVASGALGVNDQSR